MGTIRYSGNHELSDHEGFVEAELDIGSINDGGRWTSTHCLEHIGHATGRHRSGCDCGWRGPVVVTGVRDTILNDDVHDDLMEAWSAHTEPFIRMLDRTGELVDVADRYREIEDEVAHGIRRAIAAGATWAEIASALGRRADWVEGRWGHLARVA